MSTMKMRSLLPVWLFGLALLMGCGSGKEYEGPQRAEVSGFVTYNGTPVDAGAITLEAVDANGRSVSSTIQNGEYLIKEAAGPTFGKYKVKIESFEFVGEGDSKTKKQTLPDKFNESTTLELTVDKPEMKQTNFELLADSQK